MFRKAIGTTLILIALVIFGNDIVFAQLQYLDGTTAGGDSTSIQVGTTTYDVDFPSVGTTLNSARSRLQEILYYLRNFDSPYIDTPAVVGNATTTTSVNIYSDIAGFAFEEDTSTQNDAYGNIAALAQSQKCEPFTDSFDIGSRGPEVLQLQQFLNSFPETVIASSGPGSPGEETDYFGGLTFAAVFAFQAQYADVILTPLGLLNPTGYWGAATRSHANTLRNCDNQ